MRQMGRLNQALVKLAVTDVFFLNFGRPTVGVGFSPAERVRIFEVNIDAERVDEA